MVTDADQNVQKQRKIRAKLAVAKDRGVGGVGSENEFFHEKMRLALVNTPSNDARNDRNAAKPMQNKAKTARNSSETSGETDQSKKPGASAGLERE